MLPFYHSGMGRILPKGAVIPRSGQTVHVTFGEPVELRDLTKKCNCSSFQQSEVGFSLCSHPNYIGSSFLPALLSSNGGPIGVIEPCKEITLNCDLLRRSYWLRAGQERQTLDVNFFEDGV